MYNLLFPDGHTHTDTYTDEKRMKLHNRKIKQLTTLATPRSPRDREDGGEIKEGG